MNTEPAPEVVAALRRWAEVDSDPLKPTAFPVQSPLDYPLDVRHWSSWQAGRTSANVPMFPAYAGLLPDPRLGALWALGSLQRFPVSGDRLHKKALLDHCAWLHKRAQTIKGPDGPCLLASAMRADEALGLKAARVSATIQGLSASCFARAWSLTEDETWRAGALASLRGLSLPAAAGGCGVELEGHPWFANFPHPEGEPVHGQLSGHLIGLIALHEVAALCDDEAARATLAQGLASLRALLPRWDQGRWALQLLSDGRGRPRRASAYALRLQSTLLGIVAGQAGDPELQQVAARWQKASTSRRARLKARVLGRLLG